MTLNEDTADPTVTSQHEVEENTAEVNEDVEAVEENEFEACTQNAADEMQETADSEKPQGEFANNDLGLVSSQMLIEDG